MCAPTRAARAVTVVLEVGEVVRLSECGVVAVGCERERCAARPAPDHLRGEAKPALGVGASVRAPRRLVDEAPEGVDVLAQLAEDEVGAVACELGTGVEQRLIRVPAVLVRVAEHELAEAQRRLGRALLRETFEERLRDAVAEAERLVTVEVRRVEPGEHLQPGPEPADLLALEVGQSRLVPGVEEEHRVDLRRPRAAPVPVLRGVLGDVAEGPGPVRCGHPVDELVPEEGDGLLVDAELREAGARERDVDRLRLRAHVGGRERARDGAEPVPAGGCVVDPDDQEPGRGQVPVAAGDEALHVVQLGRAHSACTHCSVASRPGSPRSPARIRALLPMLAQLSCS